MRDYDLGANTPIHHNRYDAAGDIRVPDPGLRQPGVDVLVDQVNDRLTLLTYKMGLIHDRFIGAIPSPSDTANIAPIGLLAKTQVAVGLVDALVARAEMILACIDGG